MQMRSKMIVMEYQRIVTVRMMNPVEMNQATMRADWKRGDWQVIMRYVGRSSTQNSTSLVAHVVSSQYIRIAIPLILILSHSG